MLGFGLMNLFLLPLAVWVMLLAMGIVTAFAGLFMVLAD